jgi:glycine betaine/choline ABC-type transport system substrate-binding protein
MRNMYLVPFLSSLVLIFSALGCLKKEHSKELSLEKTLIIGSESGDQRYVIGDIANIALDSEENIYVLDRKSYTGVRQL